MHHVHRQEDAQPTDSSARTAHHSPTPLPAPFSLLCSLPPPERVMRHPNATTERAEMLVWQGLAGAGHRAEPSATTATTGGPSRRTGTKACKQGHWRGVGYLWAATVDKPSDKALTCDDFSKDRVLRSRVRRFESCRGHLAEGADRPRHQPCCWVRGFCLCAGRCGLRQPFASDHVMTT
ncbi:hypothetical protein SCOCK_980004 [Actinacidiphila cocklensis]|uniref:Uncharacterized protein n=1 Tax=Actinacidiphila cocklensis TaxID=887465 RepID=A0A9W4EBX7_9ACTN|nr:hypothetical protein SCOCK_980004 [Actinacidiphila cocklensis]